MAALLVAAVAVVVACGRETTMGVPQPPPEPVLAADIVSGVTYSCAIVRDSTIRCTGSMASGHPRMPDFAQLGGGADHACGILGSGALLCWGVNVYGKLNTPGGSDYREVTGGLHHTCAVRGDGTISCWGLNDAGQTMAPQGRGYYGISASLAGHHTCALNSDGAIVCWGLNDRGQTEGLPGTGYRMVRATASGGCALSAAGGVRCWGDPIPGLPENNGITSMSAGRDYLCAVRGGQISCWGETPSPLLEPPEGNGFVRVAAGDTHSCALRVDGRIKCWGSISSFPGIASD